MRPNHVHLGATALPAGRGRPALALAIAGFWLLSLACGATAQQAGTAPAAGIPSLAKVPIGELDDIPGLPGDDAPDGTRSGDAGKAEPPLPAEAVSRHSLTLPDHRLSFTARAGAMAFQDAQGGVVSEMGYFAYVVDGAEPKQCPVTFVINGGPGLRLWVDDAGAAPGDLDALALPDEAGWRDEIADLLIYR